MKRLLLLLLVVTTMLGMGSCATGRAHGCGCGMFEHPGGYTR